jgi:hypothetical protein
MSREIQICRRNASLGTLPVDLLDLQADRVYERYAPYRRMRWLSALTDRADR